MINAELTEETRPARLGAPGFSIKVLTKEVASLTKTQDAFESSSYSAVDGVGILGPLTAQKVDSFDGMQAEAVSQVRNVPVVLAIELTHHQNEALSL